MARLSSTVKRFILRELARFESPSEVQAAVKKNFDVEVSLPQLGHYDPTTVQGRKLGKKWKALFWEERKSSMEEFDDIAGASRAYRMRRLQKLIDNPMLSKNPIFVRDTIIEMEKIMGDVYTNKRKLEGDPLHVLAYVLGVDPDEIPDPEEEA